MFVELEQSPAFLTRTMFALFGVILGWPLTVAFFCLAYSFFSAGPSASFSKKAQQSGSCFRFWSFLSIDYFSTAELKNQPIALFRSRLLAIYTFLSTMLLTVLSFQSV